MKKVLTILGALTVITTPAFAQSFCTCDGTGNVLKFTNSPITYQNQAPAIPAIGEGGLQHTRARPSTRMIRQPRAVAAAVIMKCCATTKTTKQAGRALARPLVFLFFTNDRGRAET